MHEFPRSNAATNKVSPWSCPSLPGGNFNLRPWFPTNCTTAVALDLFSQGAGTQQPRYPRSSSRILKKPGQSQHQHQLSTLVLASAASTQISSQHFAIPKGIKGHQRAQRMGSHPRGQVLRQEPKVVTNGWAEGVHNEVKAREGHCSCLG